MFGWIFTGDRLEDGSPLPTFGEVRHVRPPVSLHSRGLHTAVDVYDALGCARGTILHFVRAEGVLVADRRWAASSDQRFLNSFDATSLLLSFARFCCRAAENTWPVPAVVRDWLESGDGTVAEAARLEAQAAMRTLDRDHPGKGVARAVVQLAMPALGAGAAHLLAQAASFASGQALAAGADGWNRGLAEAEAAQRVEFNRLVGGALSIDLRRLEA